MRFTPLQPHHETAVAEFVADFHAHGETSIPAFFQREGWDHAETVRRLDAWGRGEDLGEFVPNTSTFLEDDEGQILGVFNFRHYLNDKLQRHGGHVGYSVRPSYRRKGHSKALLAEAKRFAAKLGIERILVTCEPDNEGSNRCIVSGGGVLQDEFFHEEHNVRIRRYWIDITDA